MASCDCVRAKGRESAVELEDTVSQRDGKVETYLRRSLADLGQISTRESVCGLGEEGKIDVGSDGRLLEGSLEDRDSRGLVGERDVDELIESSRSKKSRIELIGSVGGSDDEDVLLGSDSVHLGLNEEAKGRKEVGRSATTRRTKSTRRIK